METESTTLGQRIKRFRLVNDIRQEDMAEKMGVSRATLINYEKGHTSINIEVLNRIKKNYPNFEAQHSVDKKPKIIIDNSVDFKVLFDVLTKSKKYIIFTTFLFIMLGIATSFMINKRYKAEITLYPAKKDLTQGMGQFQYLAANLGINSSESDQSFNIPDVVKSRLIAGKAVGQKWITENGKSANLVRLWNFDKKSWLFHNYSEKQDSTVIKEKAIKKFMKHIDVSEDKLSGLIKISTNFQDPKIASDVANFIGSQVELYIQKENSAQSKKEKLFILDRLTIVKKELKQSEVELKEFKERNRGYEDSPELFMFYSQLFREVEAKKEVYLTLQQQLELARIEEVKQSPILHILDHAVPPIQKNSPKRAYFALSFAIFGALFSSLRTVFRY